MCACSELFFHPGHIDVQAHLSLLDSPCLNVLLVLQLPDFWKDGHSSWYLTIGYDGIVLIVHMIYYLLHHICDKLLLIRILHGII